MKRLLKVTSLGLTSMLLFVACSSSTNNIELQKEKQGLQGLKKSKALTSMQWQGTKAYDKDGNDLTKENANFIGLALYDAQTSNYEFFDKKTKKSRGDIGTFFVTNDGKIRVLISKTYKYQAIVTITELNDNLFTYKRIGKDKNGNKIEIFVDHVPYNKSKLSFTKPNQLFNKNTGIVNSNKDGDLILSSTLWQGTVALDKQGNDVSSYNKNYLGIAKYDYLTNKYEFFDAKTGKTRGDYGYYDVFNDNKIRAHVSKGYKYGAVLELTEINSTKFTYARMGKDKDGNKIKITVEHIPYNGKFKAEFTH